MRVTGEKSHPLFEAWLRVHLQVTKRACRIIERGGDVLWGEREREKQREGEKERERAMGFGERAMVEKHSNKARVACLGLPTRVWGLFRWKPAEIEHYTQSAG